jgi:hypothetical protein
MKTQKRKAEEIDATTPLVYRKSMQCERLTNKLRQCSFPIQYIQRCHPPCCCFDDRRFVIQRQDHFRYVCQIHGNGGEELPDDPTSKKKRKLKKEAPPPIKYTPIDKGRQLSPLLPNDVMVTIFGFLATDISIYTWTKLRCVSRLWKKYIKESILKPSYHVTRVLCDDLFTWVHWKMLNDNAKFDQSAIDRFIECKGKTYDKRKLVRFVFFTPRPDELRMDGLIRADCLLDIVNTLVKKVTMSSTFVRDLDDPILPTQSEVFPLQAKISNDQYQDIVLQSKEKGGSSFLFMKMIQSAKNFSKKK